MAVFFLEEVFCADACDEEEFFVACFSDGTDFFACLVVDTDFASDIAGVVVFDDCDAASGAEHVDDLVACEVSFVGEGEDDGIDIEFLDDLAECRFDADFGVEV